MAICPHCQNEVAASATLCPKCGKALTSEPVIADGLLIYGMFPKRECKDASVINRSVLAKTDKRGYFEIDGKLYYTYQGKVFLVEPLRWHVLTRKGDIVTALCENLPYASPFTNKNCRFKATIAWKYLQKEFRTMAFGTDRAVKEISLLSQEQFNLLEDNPRLRTNWSEFGMATGGELEKTETLATREPYHKLSWWLAHDVQQEYSLFATESRFKDGSVKVVAEKQRCVWDKRFGVRPVIELKLK